MDVKQVIKCLLSLKKFQCEILLFQIFVERKTHREDWTGEKSVKSRFPIKEESVNAFLRGEYIMDDEFRSLVKKGKKTEQEVESMVQLANEIQYSILKKKLKPGKLFYEPFLVMVD